MGLGSAIFVMSQKICRHLKSPLATGEGFPHQQLNWSLLVSNRRTTDQTRTVTNSKGKRLTRSNRKITHHRIIGWKRPLRSSSPTIHPTPPFLLNHILKCHIYRFFKHLQGWGLNHFPGQPVPMPDYSFSKEIFHNI